MCPWYIYIYIKTLFILKPFSSYFHVPLILYHFYSKLAFQIYMPPCLKCFFLSENHSFDIFMNTALTKDYPSVRSVLGLVLLCKFWWCALSRLLVLCVLACQVSSTLGEFGSLLPCSCDIFQVLINSLLIVDFTLASLHLFQSLSLCALACFSVSWCVSLCPSLFLCVLVCLSVC